MKRMHSAVIGVLALTFAGAGLAAGTSGGMSSSSGAMSSSSAQAPDLSKAFKSTDMIGMNVSNRQNQTLGSISNLIVDQSGKVSHVVLSDTSGTSANKYIIPWERVQFTPGQNMAMLDVDPTTLPSEFAAFDESMTAPVTGSSPSQNVPSDPGSTPPPSGSGGY